MSRLVPTRLTAVAGLVIALVGALLLGAPAPGGAQTSAVRDACSVVTTPDTARCLAEYRTDTRQPRSAGGLPAGLAPDDLASAYNLPITRGAGQTIAIVDAYDAPNAEADLAVYRSTYGLPPCTSANGCFRKLNQRGEQGAYPKPNAGWALETSLDLDMASAACPRCSIVLVEADTASVYDLMFAEDIAATTQRPAAISNSYSATESEALVDLTGPHYRHSGIAIVASSGDSGFTLPGAPAVLDSVIAVGGTTLQRADNARGWAEHAWSGAGSACSAIVPKPAYQRDKHCHMRTVADVSAVADPDTGVAVYDSLGVNGHTGWFVVGGTSASAPLIAGVIGLAGNGGTIDPGYPYAHRKALFDVIGGSNRGAFDCGKDYLCNAKKGYDGPTGLGSPNGTGAF